MKYHIRKINDNQAGMVSLLVCLIMVIVISLIVFGFSEVSRNETTQTLNRQLSLEAFYAADSGINNAAAIVTQAGVAAVNETTCGVGNPSDPYVTNSTLSANVVTYTCVAVNTHPSSLKYDIPTGGATAFPVDINGGNVNSISFSWNDGNTNFGSCKATGGPFPSATNWSTSANPCDAAVLQVDLIAAGNTTSPTGLENDAYTIFLYPTRKAASTGTFANDSVYDAACTTGGTCKATVSGFAAGPEYYVRVSSVYDASYLTVCANGAGCTVPLYGAESDIDSTGKAQNVLQRLDARVSSSPLSGRSPIDAIQTGDSICKLITGYPAVNGHAASVTVGTLTGGIPSGSTADSLGCSLN